MIMGIVKTEPRKTATAGEPVALEALAKLRKVIPSVPDTIQPKQEGADPEAGQWVCADCGDVLRNNLEAYGHEKSHRLAWWTNSSDDGPPHLEEP